VHKTIPKKKRISPFFVLKFLIGSILFIWLFVWQDNGAKIVELFTQINPGYLVPLFVLVFLGNFVSCLKWQLFVKEYGNTISIFRLLALYCIGKFLDNFFPSTLGGDITRSYLLGEQIHSHGRSFASVALERLTGLLAMIILALVFALLNQKLLKEPIFLVSFAFIGAGGCLLVILLMYPSLIEKIVRILGTVPLLNTFLVKIRVIIQEMKFFKKKTSLLAKSMVYSFSFHCITILLVYTACRTIGFYPAFLDVALITPVVLLITSIPLTPNKLGVWEWAFGVFLLQAGGEIAEGVAVALLIRGLGLTVSFIGGVLLLVEKSSKDDQFSKKQKTNSV